MRSLPVLRQSDRSNGANQRPGPVGPSTQALTFDAGCRRFPTNACRFIVADRTMVARDLVAVDLLTTATCRQRGRFLGGR